MSLSKGQFQQETTHTKKLRAQALVITLLVLSIISIVVTGVIVVSKRDISQVVNNEKYERLYNESEIKVRESVEQLGISTIPTSNCTPPQICCNTPLINPGFKDYNCGTTTKVSDNLNATVDLNIIDKKAIEDYSLSKDRTLDVALNGYNGEMQISWNKPIAMEFAVIFTDSGGNAQTIRDVYDLASVYDSLVGDDPNNDINNIHDFDFQVLNAGATSTSTRFTISTINGISLGSTLSLRITPRSKIAGDVVSVSVKAANEASFPFQIREFLAKSIDSQDSSSPLASVVAKVPLNPQTDDIFDYSMLINGNLIQ